MNDNRSSYFAEIGGDFKGIQGNISGGVIHQYIITQQSAIEITQRKLIKGSPYLGFRKFETDDKDKFFGRDRWIVELVSYLESNPVLLLLGASGSGKSSLVQAGLIPKLKDKWGTNQVVILMFVPDVNPFESLYGCLIGSYGVAKAKTAQTIASNTLVSIVDQLKEDDKQWLIFIDQFEEVFTRTPKSEQMIFIQSLVQLIERNEQSIKLVMTMRADFLDKLSPYPDLGRIHDRYSKMLTDMEESELRLAIAEPAARNGVIFETGLIEQIIADFKQQSGSLPLLQYTLNLLWCNDDIHDRILNLKTYQDLGGVTGALQQQANKIYEQFNESQRKATEKIFLGLISLEAKEPLSRRVEKELFERDEIQKTVLDDLIDNRLLVSKGEDGKGTVEVAHEALLRSWQVLQELIAKNEEIIILSNRLVADAKQWEKLRQQDPQKARDELWGGSKLERIVELKQDQSLPNLDTVAIAFIDASVAKKVQLQQAEIEQQKRAKKTAQRIAAGSLVAVMISSILGWIAWQKTQQVEYNQAESLGREALALLNDGQDLDAFMAAIKAGKILRRQHTTNPVIINAFHKALNETKEHYRIEDIGDKNFVSRVAITPDGKTLVSGSHDNTIKVWNLESNAEPRILTGHEKSVNSVAITPDGKTLVSGSKDGIIKVWDLNETNPQPRTLTGHTEPVWSVAITPDGKTLVSGGDDKTIKVWNLDETKPQPRTLTGHDWVSSVAITPDGKTLVSGSKDKTIKMWNLNETKPQPRTLTGHKDWVYSVAITPDGKTLGSGSKDGIIKVWNLDETNPQPHTLTGHTVAVNSVAITPDGKTLVSGSWDKTIKVWNLETYKESSTLTGHKNGVSSVAITPDGKTLVSGSWGGIIKVWNLETDKKPSPLTGHEAGVSSVALTPDGKTLVSGSWGGNIKVWNLKMDKEPRNLTRHDSVSSIALTPDGKTLVSGSKDGIIKVWNLETYKELRTLTEHKNTVWSLAITPDGKTLVSGSWDTTIKVWNLESNSEPHTLIGHEEPVFSVAITPDGKTVVSGSIDKTIKVWNLESNSEPHTLIGHKDGVNSVAITPDGKTLVSGSEDTTIKVWNLETYKESSTLTGHKNTVWSLAITPDGKTLVSGSEDTTIKVWNLETYKELRTLTGHEKLVWSVAITPDGKTLVSGSEDETIRVWEIDFDVDSLMRRSCEWVRGYLSHPFSDVREEDRRLCEGIL